MLSLPLLADSTAALSTNNAYVRQPMPGRTVTAGYFVLHNHSAQDVRLIGASSSAFSRAELHSHSHKDGMMRMEQVDEIIIVSGGNVELAPGGLHLMLFEPVATLEIGQTVPMQLHFADGQQLTLAMPVVAMPKR
nr:copper chaperone PCu(A)C [Rheinheimera maricola]